MFVKVINNTYLYTYQFDNVQMRCGMFTLQAKFSKHDAKMPLELDVDQGDTFPTLWANYSPDSDYVYIVCLSILLNNSRPWLVHRSRVIDAGMLQ